MISIRDRSDSPGITDTRSRSRLAPDDSFPALTRTESCTDDGHPLHTRRRHLDHEKRVAIGQRKNQVGIKAGVLNQRCHRLRRKTTKMYPHQILWCQITDHLSQRMVIVDLTVTVGENQQTVDCADPPTQIFDDIEGGLVGPVSVLHHQNRRTETTRQKVQKDLHHRPPVALLQNLTKRRLLPGDIPERTPRLRSQQIVTKPEIDMRLIVATPETLPDQKALANTRLTPEQDHFPPSRVHPGQQTRQQPKLFVPVQEHEPKTTELAHTRLQG